MFNELIKRHNELTQDNHHGAALEMLARNTDQAHYAKILQHVNAIHELERELPHHLSNYRETIRKRVEARARIVMGSDFERLG